MISNPFSSTTFLSYWAKHFLSNKETHKFNFSKNLSFYKSRLPGLYLNTGKNLTKGITYEFNPICGKEEKGKTFLIYDVIDFSTQEEVVKNSSMGLYSVRQYPGFLIELESYSSLAEFMSKNFKKSSRYKLRKYKKRLEESFNISFKAYQGEVSKEEFNSVFDRFRTLLEKRFKEKKITNNNLDSKEWNFYKDMAYPMMLEKKATLFVLYNNNEAISVTLAYLSDNRIFDAITVFDIDYAKFHLGSVTIMNLIEWSIQNSFKVFDFSKGFFDYKKRWASKKYTFEYHILYDSKSIKSRFLAFVVKLFFEGKQYLRDIKINDRLHKFTYWLRNKNTSVKSKSRYYFTDAKKEYLQEELIKINWSTKENHFLKKPVFDFLYLNNEKMNSLQTFEILGKYACYLFQGESKTLELNIKLISK